LEAVHIHAPLQPLTKTLQPGTDRTGRRLILVNEKYMLMDKASLTELLARGKQIYFL